MLKEEARNETKQPMKPWRTMRLSRGQQQEVKRRRKRLMPSEDYWRMARTESKTYQDLANLNDPRFPQMWYLNRGHMLDMNVQGAWVEGYTGKGIVVTILDDGVERENPDLKNNYDPEASFDVNDNDKDPNPRYDFSDFNRHGTRCAGEVAASANNTLCAGEVSASAGIGGVRMLDGDVTDSVEARSLSLNAQHIDIYSASWGPDDDGKTVDGPGKLAIRAFTEGIQKGRGGKGSIFVWASGNGGRDHDSCNCDGYTNSIWTLSVSSVTENGLVPWYSEKCSSTLATTYSSGSSGEQKIVTTDLHNGCTSSHTGTSASAPLAAGIIALTLEANPSLTWRDVQHITVRTAHVGNLRATDWKINAVGRNYSHSFGYGLMDATAMVLMAKTWVIVPEQKTSSVQAHFSPLSIPKQSGRSTQMDVTDSGDIQFLEHVQAVVSLSATRRGDVEIYLVSPGGTISQLLTERHLDSSQQGFNEWPFLTMFSWGENPLGTWELRVENKGRNKVELKSWSLTFYGTATDPQPNLEFKKPTALPEKMSLNKALIPENPEPKAKIHKKPEPKEMADKAALKVEHCKTQASSVRCVACQEGYYLLSGKCTPKCPDEGFYPGVSNSTWACLPCYYSCKACTGPDDYQCKDCYQDAQLSTHGDHGQSFCHNKSLVFKVFASSRWYYMLSVAFLFNFCIVLILVLYILKCGQSKSSRSEGINKSGLARYSPIHVNLTNREKDDDTVPFHDYGSSE